VGGHRFAGNVLIYPGGDWYGYVTPEDVPRIVDEHIIKGEILVDLWRGRLGMTPEEQQEQMDVWHGG
jgi:(2Fe-2S) ferredoxin